MTLVELNRRFTWIWRLSCSSFCEPHLNSEKAVALWVFDTAHQPDGGVMSSYMEQVVIREDLQLWSFGPHRKNVINRFGQIFKFLTLVTSVFHDDFNKKFNCLVSNQLRKIFIYTSPSVLLVGASKGTFASIASQLAPFIKVWEVQHGLLDSSYFPLNVERFYARSQVSARTVEDFSPLVEVKVFDHSLDPPEGFVSTIDLCNVSELICYSKNPGGGCTLEDLSRFERACFLVAKRNGLKFKLQLHPRDKLLKLIWRHRRIHVLGWIFHFDSQSVCGRRLVVSAYSSALITESSKYDYIINVAIGVPSEITRREYKWVPTVSITEINTLAKNFDAFIRTN